VRADWRAARKCESFVVMIRVEVARSLGAVVLVSGVVACSSNSSSGGGAANDAFAEARARCVSTINNYRATLNLPPYQAWNDAATNACADGQAQSDSASSTAHGAFGKCGEHAQNECPGWPAPPDSVVDNCLAAMWAEGPGTDFSKHGHYINMSSTTYTKVACGFYQTASGDYWAVQDFQ
jgi:hypothetical protein